MRREEKRREEKRSQGKHTQKIHMMHAQKFNFKFARPPCKSLYNCIEYCSCGEKQKKIGKLTADLEFLETALHDLYTTDTFRMEGRHAHFTKTCT